MHHYRVFRRGLPHFAFRRDYLERLRVFVSQASALQQCTLPSPAPGRSGPAGNPRPGDGEAGSPKKARRIQGRKQKTRVREEPVCEQSALAVVQDVRGLAGALVYDCWPPLLPVSIPLQDFRHSSDDRPTAPSSLAAAPVEVTPGFSGSVRERVATPGFVEMPWDDPGTDLEEELEYVSPLPMMITGRLFSTSGSHVISLKC